MALTPEQIKERKKRIGASDMAALMGVPSFVGKNAYSVWAEKCDLLEPERKTSDAITAGNLLEPVVLDYAEIQHGAIARNVVVFDPAGAPIASTLDGQVISTGNPVEAKTSGIEGPVFGRWGEPESLDIPDAYMVQCQTQLLCTRAQVCHLVALLGGRGFVEYTILPDDGLIAKIRDIASDFYATFVATKRDPRDGWAERLQQAHGLTLLTDPCQPALETVKRFKREPSKIITLSDPTKTLAWDAARISRLEAEKLEKVALASVLADLGDAEAAQLPGGAMLTYMEQNGAAIIDRKAMEADGILNKYARPNKYRVPRLKMPK